MTRRISMAALALLIAAPLAVQAQEGFHMRVDQSQNAADPDDVPSALSELLRDPIRRADMGAEARRYVESGRGATEASARLVLDLLSGVLTS